jgi:hypothetical protein
MSDNWGPYYPFDWSPGEENLFSDLLGNDPFYESDRYLQTLFHESMFNFDNHPRDREALFDTLTSYLEEVYGIDFWEDFDWEGYRELYDMQ